MSRSDKRVHIAEGGGMGRDWDTVVAGLEIDQTTSATEGGKARCALPCRPSAERVRGGLA